MNEYEIKGIPYELQNIGKGFLIVSLIMAAVLFIIAGGVNSSITWADKGFSPFYLIASLSTAFQGFVLYFAFKAAYLISVQLNAIRQALAPEASQPSVVGSYAEEMQRAAEGK